MTAPAKWKCRHDKAMLGLGQSECSICYFDLPEQMRRAYDRAKRDPKARGRSDAERYLTARFQSIRHFGGGKKRVY